MYLTFDDYLDMGGKIQDEDLFDRACFRAQSEIDRRTFKRLAADTEYTDAVKRCMYELVELFADSISTYETSGGAVMSHSNDGVSESYVTASAADWTNTVLPSRTAYIINTYLAEEHNAEGVNLLYRGVG